MIWKLHIKILFYDGPTHALRRWCQEMMVYSFSYIHRSHEITVDVNYLFRMHNPLVKAHTIVKNTFSTADRVAHPWTYKAGSWEGLLRRCQYWFKQSDIDSASSVHTCNTQPETKRLKVTQEEHLPIRCYSIIQLSNNHLVPSMYKWGFNKEDEVLQSEVL